MQFLYLFAFSSWVFGAEHQLLVVRVHKQAAYLLDWRDYWIVNSRCCLFWQNQWRNVLWKMQNLICGLFSQVQTAFLLRLSMPLAGMFIILSLISTWMVIVWPPMCLEHPWWQCCFWWHLKRENFLHNHIQQPDSLSHGYKEPNSSVCFPNGWVSENRVLASITAIDVH